MNRGIFANLYAPLKKKMSAEALREVYLSYYMREPFVTILDAYESPEVKAVTYTNLCHIGISVSGSRQEAIVTAALDNLVKGAFRPGHPEHESHVRAGRNDRALMSQLPQGVSRGRSPAP